MAEQVEQREEVTPEEERAITLEKIREVLRYALADTEDGPVLDLDLLTRLLIQRAVPYRVLNRELTWAELQVVRDELHTQRTRASAKVEEGDGSAEACALAQRRVDALERREDQILEQLWPLS